jgi:quercetin dioxygenase-like cupin family protein
MKRQSIAAAGLLAGVFMAGSVLAQQPGIKRELIQQGELSAPGYVVVQARAELPPGVSAGRHTHPGEEVTVMTEGTLVLEIAGQAPRTYKAGEAFIVPAGVPHDARNTGDAPARLLGTWIIEKGKPLATPAP